KSNLYTKRLTLPAPSTPVGRILAARRAGLVADLGGEDALSTSQRALIDVALRSWAILDATDAYLLSLPSPVHKRRRELWRVVVGGGRFASQLEATFARLGVERKAREVESLDQYLNSKAKAEPSAADAADSRQLRPGGDGQNDGDQEAAPSDMPADR